MYRDRLGSQLVEMLVALGMIGVLAMVSLPMLTKASDQARAQACRANLETIGKRLAAEVEQHGCLPGLTTAATTPGATDPLIELMRYDSPHVLVCPSDEKAGEPGHTSYRWFDAWNGIDPGSVYGLVDLPLVVEKQSYHDPVNNQRTALMLYGEPTRGHRFLTRWVDGDSLVARP